MSFGFLARLGAGLAVTTALALLLGSCSGESQESGGSGGQGTGGSAGGSKAGSGGAGGSGADPCANVRCAMPSCPSGETPAIPPGECCPACPGDPNCATVLCTDVMCPTGQHAEVPDGECCPRCISDDPCEAGRMAYDALYEKRTTELDAFSCNEDEGCWVLPSFICRPGCGTAVSYASSSLLQVELSGAALACLSCPDITVTCTPMPTAVCMNGTCVLSPQ